MTGPRTRSGHPARARDARERSRDSTHGEAVVARVGFDVAHDSDGLVIVTLRYPNGAEGDLQVEGAALARVLAQLDLANVRELVGRPFSELAPALPMNASR